MTSIDNPSKRTLGTVLIRETFPCITLDDHRPDGEGEVESAPDVNIAYRPGINLPFNRLEFVDQLHRPNLWCPGDGTGRKTGTEGVDWGHIVASVSVWV